MQDSYTGFQCKYLGGDPRLLDTGPAEVDVSGSVIRITVKGENGINEVSHCPAADIQQVFFQEQRLRMEQAEYEEGIQIGDNETLIRPTVVVVVRDPEGILPEGIRVRLRFRSEYHAKVFEKRCTDLLNLAPF